MQYTHARCASVLTASGLTPGEAVDYTRLCEPEERALVRKLVTYPEVVAQAAQEWEPSILAQHLLALAADFNSYWARGSKDHRVRILRQDAPEVTAARVALTAALRVVLRNGLRLLGVPTPDAM
jgi:arginyl-tRNA synthetase